jgi:hypothetical protein
LDYVCELVCDQPSAGLAMGLILARSEHHVLARGIRTCAEPLRKRRGTCAVVNANGLEGRGEARLHRQTHGRVERPAAAGWQHCRRQARS